VKERIEKVRKSLIGFGDTMNQEADKFGFQATP
jgi:hypothetical protein